jgi:negative regulator of sigma E activity
MNPRYLIILAVVVFFVIRLVNGLKKKQAADEQQEAPVVRKVKKTRKTPPAPPVAPNPAGAASKDAVLDAEETRAGSRTGQQTVDLFQKVAHLPPLQQAFVLSEIVGGPKGMAE